MISYVSTPYTKYKTGIEEAFKDASKASAELMRKGFNVYSPIAHCHPIAIYGNMDPLDFKMWLGLQEYMMKVCGECLVVQMQGWEESYGVNYEMNFFLNLHKRVRFFSFPDLIELTH